LSLPTYSAAKHAHTIGETGASFETPYSQLSKSPSGRSCVARRLLTALTLTVVLAGVIFVSYRGHESFSNGVNWTTGSDNSTSVNKGTSPPDGNTATGQASAEGNSLPVGIASTSETAESVTTVPDAFPARETDHPVPSAPLPVTSVVAAEPLSNSELVRRCEPSVCMVRTKLGNLGTGFVVGPGIVATNEHVIGLSNISNVVIQFPNRPNDRAYPVTLAWAVPGRDLVLLRARDLPTTALPLPIATLDLLQKGDRLIVIGHPGGLPYVVTEGLFGSVQTMDGEEFLQLSMSVNPGNSGGPALTTRGRVAGVVTLKSSQDGIGLAIAGDVLDEALKQLSTVPTADIETLLKRWRSRQTGSRLVAGCSLSSELIDLYLASSVESEGRTGPEVRIDKSDEVLDRLEELSQLNREISVKDTSLIGPHLRDEERQIIEQLATCFEVLGRHAAHSDGPLNKLLSETAEPLRQWPQLKQRLNSTLGLMGLESEVSATIGR
jgi:S1-C subfamily serine protease